MTCALIEADHRPHVLLAKDAMMWAEQVGRTDDPAIRRRFIKELSRAVRSMRAHERAMVSTAKAR